MSYLAHFWQSTCVLPVSIVVSPQRTPVPQRTFLLVTIIQNVIFLAHLLKSIETHCGLMVEWSSKHHHVLLLQRFSGCVALPCCAAKSKMCQNGNPRHVTVVVDLHLQPNLPIFLEKAQCAVLKRTGK